MSSLSLEAAARDKLDQIVRACFLKTVEVILHARIVPYSSELHRSKLNRTFNIELDELDAVRRELGGWDPRRPQPLFIDVLLDLDSGSAPQPQPAGSPDAARRNTRPVGESVVLLERWQLLYLPSSQSLERHNQAALYKRCGVLLRALHARLRLMPAHRLSSRLAKKAAEARTDCGDADYGCSTPSSASPHSGAGSGCSACRAPAGSSGAGGGGGHGQPCVRVLFALQLGEGEHAQPIRLAPDGLSEVAPSSAPFPAGSQPLEISLPPIDPVHGQFHVSALFCSERERPLKQASTRSFLAAVAMHTHGTIIPDYLDTVPFMNLRGLHSP
ncbi:autophagy-related protein 13-domain-containing protein [Pavlovales sp. CCMP2436]|nr:autophagy-related protein 13-domain-containing protein [Pavlovales sp. CCMP2436]